MKILYGAIVLAVVGAGVWFGLARPSDVGNAVEKSDLIRLESPLPNARISSPLTLTGEARGNWFFEASFPIYVTDWDGLIIGEGYATAEGEWMTTEFVPFKAVVTFDTSKIRGQYSDRGTLVLKKDNPSGLPEHDDALEIPVRFALGDQSSSLEQYANATYGLSFSYPATYELTERDAPGSELRAHHSITLMRREDLPLPQGGEGPPAITIDMYQNNLDTQTTEGWIRNSSNSNFKLGDGTLASTTIAGLPALSYRWSGLYEGTTVALAEPNWVYAFSVTYLEIGAPIIQDFALIRESVKLSK